MMTVYMVQYKIRLASPHFVSNVIPGGTARGPSMPDEVGTLLLRRNTRTTMNNCSSVLECHILEPTEVCLAFEETVLQFSQILGKGVLIISTTSSD
jgi:hypothetical protein